MSQKKNKKKNKKKSNNSSDSDISIDIPDKNGSVFSCFISGCKERSVWSAKASLMNHIDQHLSGGFKGTVPDQFFKSWKLTTCSLCKGLISKSNKMGIHKKCQKSQDTPSQENASSNSSQPTSDLHTHPLLNQLSWSQIFKLNVSTTTRIPYVLKSFWGTLFHNTVRTALYFNDANSWKLFFLLPQLVLRMPKRGGGGKFVKELNANMKRWQNGELQQLFDEARKPGVKSFSGKHDFKRSFRLCTLGRYSDALRALENQEFCVDSNDNRNDLCKLHPRKPDGVKTKAPIKSLVISSQTIVKDCLLSFPKGSAPGLDGYRAEHLLDAINSVQNNSMAELLTDLVNHIIAGKIHAEVREWFAGGKLCALPKKDGGVRPICMASVIRRLCCKAVAKIYQTKFSSFLAPFQLGVGVKAGTECLIHEVDLLYRSGAQLKDLAILKIDFRNAFNMVDRQAFLDTIHEHFPELYNFVVSMYGVNSKLLFYSSVIHSEEGTQQGDPLGPVLFALALKVVPDMLRSKLPDLVLNRWYLDDGYVGGKVKTVAEALKIIKDTGKSIGLELRTSKSELFFPSGKVSKRNAFPADIKIACDGIDVLGAPVGSKPFISSFFDSQYTGLKNLLNRLKDASSYLGSQATFTLLSKCISFCKMVFHARTVHPSLLINHAFDYDELVKDCFLLLTPGLTSEQLEQSSLPIRCGGLGLRRLSAHLLPAFLSSVATAVKFLETSYKKVKDRWALDEMLQCFNSEIASADRVVWSDIDSQKTLSAKIDSKQLLDFSSGLSGMDKFRFCALQGELSSGWLTSIPNHVHSLTSSEFETCIKLRLGCNMHKDQFTCDFCGGNRAVDQRGLHGLLCRGGGDRISRHNAIRDLLADLCSRASFSVEKVVVEKKHLLDESGERPADVFIPSWNGGRGLCLDVTVSSPLQTAYSTNYTLGLAARKSAEHKDTRYKSKCAAKGNDFLPFSIEAFGAMDDRATSFLNKVASRLATREGQDLSLVKSYVFGRVSTVLHRCVARSVLKRRRDSEDVFKSFDSREFLNKFTVPPSSSQARSAPSSIPPTPPVSNSGTYTSTATKKTVLAVKRKVLIKKTHPPASTASNNPLPCSTQGLNVLLPSPDNSSLFERIGNLSSTVANITSDTAPLIVENQTLTKETVDGSASNSNTSDQTAITSFTSDIHDLQYSDSSSNVSSCNNSILERMDLLELKLLEAQKDLDEFDGNLDAISHRILPATELLDISISPIMSPIRSAGNWSAMKEL